jgi:hypothetical protein
MAARVTAARIPVTVRWATGTAAASQVRFATDRGVWGAWSKVEGAHVVALGPGIGWHAVFAQVRDSVGRRSRVFFQVTFVGPANAHWMRGTTKADTIRGGRGADYIDASPYDGVIDHITCGPGRDSVLAQQRDVVARDCEHVIRVVTPPS